jgi:inorganic triphosphatase YgiF
MTSPDTGGQGASSLTMSAMQEIELKFQIPTERIAGVRQAIEALARQNTPGQTPTPLPLHAAYYDTPDNALARQKMALRVRREGDDWVQTFKAAGQDAMTRVEDNQARHVPDQHMPAPDLSLHPMAAQQALQRALPWNSQQDPSGQTLGLIALYETRFDRRQALITEPQGQVIVCIDEGSITAGPLSEPLAELELELSSGHPLALLSVARRWVADHGLWLDVQSKAYRGTRLAQARASGQKPHARPVAAMQVTSSSITATLNLALDAAAGNWSEVAALRPGWSAALLAWQQTLAALLTQADQQPELTSTLPASFWQATRAQCQALNELLQGLDSGTALSHEQDATWCHAAQALAQQADTTQWALDLLQVLKAE